MDNKGTTTSLYIENMVFSFSSLEGDGYATQCPRPFFQHRDEVATPYPCPIEGFDVEPRNHLLQETRMKMPYFLRKD